jgi:hypothetical protein
VSASAFLKQLAAIPPRRASIVFLVTYMVAAAGLAYQLGQDINWDLRNYHYYGAYAALENRIDRDVHAAGVQTFLNPLLHLPLFFAIRAEIPPVAFGLALAALQGLALWYVHRITVVIVEDAAQGSAQLMGLVAATTAAFGAAFQGELGNTMGDIFVAILVLAGLALVLERSANHSALPRTAAMAGGLLGLAMGAKQVGGIYGLGLLCVVWMAAGSRRHRVLCMLVLVICAAGSFIATNGYWMWLMQDRFGSPLFPFYNLIFHSEWAPMRDFATDIYARLPSRQVPFSLPFMFLREQMVSAEVPFRDARLAAGVISLLTITLILLARARSNGNASIGFGRKRLAMVAIFYTVSYIVWSQTMTLYRFAMPLELLSGVLVVGAITYAVDRRTVRLAVTTVTCATLLLWTKPMNLDRIPWQPSYFGVSAADFAEFERATIVLADFPTAYVVPFFPESATFVRLISNWGLEPDSWMERRARMRIQLAPSGRLFILAKSTDRLARASEAILNRLGFTVDASECRSFEAHVDRLRMCPVSRH